MRFEVVTLAHSIAGGGRGDSNVVVLRAAHSTRLAPDNAACVQTSREVCGDDGMFLMIGARALVINAVTCSDPQVCRICRYWSGVPYPERERARVPYFDTEGDVLPSPVVNFGVRSERYDALNSL